MQAHSWVVAIKLPQENKKDRLGSKVTYFHGLYMWIRKNLGYCQHLLYFR